MRLLAVPHLGFRPAEEFVYGGPFRPAEEASAATDAEWVAHVFHRNGAPEVRKEWWYHRPSATWCLLLRDTATDRFVEGAAPTESPGSPRSAR